VVLDGKSFESAFIASGVAVWVIIGNHGILSHPATTRCTRSVGGPVWGRVDQRESRSDAARPAIATEDVPETHRRCSRSLFNHDRVWVAAAGSLQWSSSGTIEQAIAGRLRAPTRRLRFDARRGMLAVSVNFKRACAVSGWAIDDTTSDNGKP